MLKRVLIMIPILLAVYAISSSVVKMSAGPQQNQPSTSSAQHEHDQPSPAGMADMMKMHEQMMAEMKAADAKLDQLLSRMNAATGNAKTSALADVVNELARQQKTMHERMGTMHDHMMHDQMMMGGRGMMMKKP
jgi:ABC-type microcin C transport system permease subunit YejB